MTVPVSHFRKFWEMGFKWWYDKWKILLACYNWVKPFPKFSVQFQCTLSSFPSIRLIRCTTLFNKSVYSLVCKVSEVSVICECLWRWRHRHNLKFFTSWSNVAKRDLTAFAPTPNQTSSNITCYVCGSFHSNLVWKFCEGFTRSFDAGVENFLAANALQLSYFHVVC